MRYDEYHLAGDVYFPAQAHERQMIKCIWYVAGTFPRTQYEQILPSGAAELIFNLSVPISFQRNIDCLTGGLPRCFINGINLNDVTLVKETGQYLIGIQLYPFALKALFDIPANEFTNNVADLTLLDRNVNALWHMLGDCKSFKEQAHLLLGWAANRLSKKKLSADIPRMAHLYSILGANTKRISCLASDYSFSERSLRRKCNEWFGMNTETFLLYRKYLESLTLLHHCTQSLTEIAYRSGYYDQSHFIREFKSFTSLTPKEYRSSKSIGMGHIFHFAQ